MQSNSHLLPKKSWNVYNADNVERVRRDEAAAKAAEEAKEERMQEADAARRLAILRGEKPPPLPEEEEGPLDPAAGAVSRGSGRERFTGEKRKRKRVGEDDTDFEMRVARERAAEGVERKRTTDAPLELAGLLDPAEQRELVKPPGRDEVVAEKQRAAQRLANPVLKDALGIKEDPWFVKPLKPWEVAEEPGRDAWGNEDPGRKVRDMVRLDKNDPLAMMKRGAAKVREVTQERKREMEERERELKVLRKEERRREKRRKRDGKVRDEADNLEGFSLDAPTERGDLSARTDIDIAAEKDGSWSLDDPHRTNYTNTARRH
ncbi:hypothetical protein CONLIGDRAFT_682283 [Coniochaeta ligniaria NRRL 30616]|uniref:CBF1-interacting co-repressor CIR N-terminal domain-containing protein n=1 Tax=Coniochaeta ligniaria NRRL 30616 TaxID=1408157 RepID=A0A1J7IIU4_9PEZI|nr:hypothetical protein CONLIGDRAFT_682283 [Coniochaeta ligniaria NRRL 30616]